MKHSSSVPPLLLVVVLVSATATCAGPLTGPVKPGDWGGEHIALVVTANGASVEYDCASGTVDQPLVAAEGRFTAVGTHTRGHGGPVRDDEIPDRHPARYDGQVDEETMTLEVTLLDSGEKLGRYTLVHGRSPSVFKCL